MDSLGIAGVETTLRLVDGTSLDSVAAGRPNTLLGPSGMLLDVVAEARGCSGSVA